MFSDMMTVYTYGTWPGSLNAIYSHEICITTLARLNDLSILKFPMVVTNAWHFYVRR